MQRRLKRTFRGLFGATFLPFAILFLTLPVVSEIWPDWTTPLKAGAFLWFASGSIVALLICSKLYPKRERGPYARSMMSSLAGGVAVGFGGALFIILNAWLGTYVRPDPLRVPLAALLLYLPYLLCLLSLLVAMVLLGYAVVFYRRHRQEGGKEAWPGLRHYASIRRIPWQVLLLLPFGLFVASGIFYWAGETRDAAWMFGYGLILSISLFVLKCVRAITAARQSKRSDGDVE